MKSLRYLTKSRFQTALECPTKLFYVRKPEYPSTKEDNDFLMALAEGGFQVGALAKCYHPEGIDITASGYEEPLRQTNELLQRENVTIFEAAIRFENLFIRVDVLEKIGDQINLIEVKAKSINPQEDNFLTKKGGFIDKKWLPYLNDVAFQTWVVEKAFPDYTVNPFLMLADKSKMATVDGLNQHFFLKKEGERSKVVIKGDVRPEALGGEVLIKMPVRHLVDKIWQGTDRPANKKSAEDLKPFTGRIAEYSDYYQKDQKYKVTLGRKCKDCEFRVDDEQLAAGKKSGYRECWQEKLGWDDDQFARPHIFEIWNYRDAELRMAEGVYLMEDLNLEEEFMQPDKETGQLNYNGTRAGRQYLQVTEMLRQPARETIEPQLFTEIAQWTYPLHFIDFETCMAAIPFHKQRRPYEQLAFQFSCHTVYEDGRMEHQQWISAEPGEFPNFEFLAALKTVLDKDDGTILRFSHHENTVLRQIQDQLCRARDKGMADYPGNGDELIAWVDTVVHFEYRDGQNEKRHHYGARNMVDMCALVQDYYYHPAMRGSNSIKVVLPTVLRVSPFLKEKYSRAQATSNSGNKIWWEWDEDVQAPKNPYDLLEPLDVDIDTTTDERVFDTERIHEGGAAMMAYAKMKFTEMGDAERQAIIQGLLKYCELDTLAMVMIWEHWKFVKND